jgi:hypothetical protein
MADSLTEYPRHGRDQVSRRSSYGAPGNEFRSIVADDDLVDRLETVGYLALAEAGVRIADAQPAMEQAHAVRPWTN